MKKILLIDNFDSFSYNLYQLIGGLNPDIAVVRNTITIDEIEAIAPDALILSPGPGKPKDAGICIDAIKYFSPHMPILGICLGHQAIVEAFSGIVTYADKIMHGKTSFVNADTDCPIFKGMDKRFEVARYHSLAADNKTFPDVLKITAQTDDNVIMALKHKNCDTYGLQFHPESILTPSGTRIAKNFMEIIE